MTIPPLHVRAVVGILATAAFGCGRLHYDPVLATPGSDGSHRDGRVAMDADSAVIEDGSVSMDVGRLINDGGVAIHDGGDAMDVSVTDDAGVAMDDAGMSMDDAGMSTDDAGMATGAVRGLTLGGGHTCVLLDTGAVRCWGYGSHGRLGYGNTNNVGDDETPASVGDVPLGATATQIVGGGTHTCVLLSTGSVRCWGWASSGQLGYGNINNIGDNETPASAGDVPLGATAIQLAAGSNHTCALLDTGAVRCWGLGGNGQLGYGNISNIGDNETPASAGDVPLGAAAIQITAGHWHTCALLDAGRVRCWGNSSYGQLGYGHTNNIGDDETPAVAGDVSLGAAAVQIASKEYHTCALLDTGAVRCWGYGGRGALGYGNTNHIGDNETPASAGDVSVGGTVASIATGGHTCALLDTGAVRCWGSSSEGELGYGNTNSIGDDEVPAVAGDVAIGAMVREISVGYEHSCAWLVTGAVRCWGDGRLLGYGNVNNIGDNETPASAGDVPFQ